MHFGRSNRSTLLLWMQIKDYRVAPRIGKRETMDSRARADRLQVREAGA